jgi:16S rRNA (cytidine1402-2'-O)-methyltransferase
MVKIYIVATPIGNLKDITLRALDVLKEVDLILAEDTRKAKTLLDHYGIKKRVISYYQRSSERKIQEIFDNLVQGKTLALISEAGTPGISDPGNELISKIIEEFGDEVEIIPVPGPSAVITAASISGFPMQKFLFLGFVPKRKQNKFFQEIINSKYSTIFFESPYRILKTLEKLKELKPDLKTVVARELTKKFETVYRGEISEVIKKLQKDKTKGEFVVIVHLGDSPQKVGLGKPY